MQTTKPLLDLTRQDTEIIKGIALMLLLIHHLFYIPNGRFAEFSIMGCDVVNLIGQACKVCVPLFVFLSGYGLTASADNQNKVNWKQFFIRRFSKLYLNYWLIWAIFIPIGLLACDLSVSEIYGNHPLEKCILDFLGILNVFGLYGINPTWWFFSCIILLYLIFPAIYESIRRVPISIYFWFAIALTISFCPITYVQPIRYYLLTFVLGIACRRIITPPYLQRAGLQLHAHCLCGVILIVLTLIAVAYIPLRPKCPHALLCDSIVALIIIVLFSNITLINPIRTFISLVGRHSFNIFMFHTFLFFLYIPEIIYWNSNPIVCFLTLLILSLIISISIERCKQFVGFTRLEGYLAHSGQLKTSV